MELFEKELKRDPVATTLVDMTKLQLVEVTRKKIRKPFVMMLKRHFLKQRMYTK